jgi:hypothetical protein
MRSEKMEEGDGLKYRDVLDMIGDYPRETARETARGPEREKPAPMESFELVADWTTCNNAKKRCSW